MENQLRPIDRIEIHTLIDNYIDLVSQDNTPIVQRAIPLKDMVFRNCILAEHGFSSLVTVSEGDSNRSCLFDFGFSNGGAASNAKALGLDLNSVEIMALSHGHLDHTGGLGELYRLVGKKNVKLVLHPSAFIDSRFLKIADEFKVVLPSLDMDVIEKEEIELEQTTEPYPMLNDTVIFLGEIPRETGFEKGAANLRYMDEGEEKQDPIKDDTAIVAHLKGKGLVILSGCAHSGIINTVRYAQKVTGVEKVHMVMGGFHLTGPDMGPVVVDTIEALKEIDPDYIVPTHCTGRNAVMEIEKAMPEKFILNMSGTKLSFNA